MKTEKLILNYQRRGIKLSVSDNKLHFSAPQNILTDEDKDILKVSAKYCYAAHELRLHQNDRCKRFTLF